MKFLSAFAEILRAPFNKPLRAMLFMNFVVFWPAIIRGLVALHTYFTRPAFHG